jgi:hypothetical protein
VRITGEMGSGEAKCATSLGCSLPTGSFVICDFAAPNQRAAGGPSRFEMAFSHRSVRMSPSTMNARRSQNASIGELFAEVAGPGGASAVEQGSGHGRLPAGGQQA